MSMTIHTRSHSQGDNHNSYPHTCTLPLVVFKLDATQKDLLLKPPSKGRQDKWCWV